MESAAMLKHPLPKRPEEQLGEFRIKVHDKLTALGIVRPLGEATDMDKTMVEYVVALVANGKTLHETADLMEVFLGDKLSLFIDWLQLQLFEKVDGKLQVRDVYGSDLASDKPSTAASRATTTQLSPKKNESVKAQETTHVRDTTGSHDHTAGSPTKKQKLESDSGKPISDTKVIRPNEPGSYKAKPSDVQRSSLGEFKPTHNVQSAVVAKRRPLAFTGNCGTARHLHKYLNTAQSSLSGDGVRTVSESALPQHPVRTATTKQNIAVSGHGDGEGKNISTRKAAVGKFRQPLEQDEHRTVQAWNSQHESRHPHSPKTVINSRQPSRGTTSPEHVQKSSARVSTRVEMQQEKGPTVKFTRHIGIVDENLADDAEDMVGTRFIITMDSDSDDDQHNGSAPRHGTRGQGQVSVPEPAEKPALLATERESEMTKQAAQYTAMPENSLCRRFPHCPKGDQCDKAHPQADCPRGKECLETSCSFNHKSMSKGAMAALMALAGKAGMPQSSCETPSKASLEPPRPPQQQPMPPMGNSSQPQSAAPPKPRSKPARHQGAWRPPLRQPYGHVRGNMNQLLQQRCPHGLRCVQANCPFDHSAINMWPAPPFYRQ